MDEYRKLKRMLNYVKCTMADHLVVRINKGFNVAKWYADAAFAVHPDFKLHSGGRLLLSDKGDTVVSMSQKQKLNTHSSTEAELVGVDDVIGKLMWVQEFLEEQGFGMGTITLFQDNRSAILLETKGKVASTKRTRHINIRYFHVLDLVEHNRLKIEYAGTQDMVADFFTKPLQGTAFSRFKSIILGQRGL